MNEGSIKRICETFYQNIRFFLVIYLFLFFFGKVAEVADVSELDKEDTTSVLSESGLSMTLTVSL